MPRIKSAVVCLVGGLACWACNGANAQIFGQRTEVTNCATAIGGNADRTTIQSGIPPDVFEALTAEFRKTQQDRKRPSIL
jgi:hypothetical protein